MSIRRAAQFDSNSVQVQSKFRSGSVGVHTMQSPLFVACLFCAPVLPSDFHSFCSDFFGSCQAKKALSLLRAEKKQAACLQAIQHYVHCRPPREQVPTSLALLEAGVTFPHFFTFPLSESSLGLPSAVDSEMPETSTITPAAARNITKAARLSGCLFWSLQGQENIWWMLQLLLGEKCFKLSTSPFRT